MESTSSRAANATHAESAQSSIDQDLLASAAAMGVDLGSPGDRINATATDSPSNEFAPQDLDDYSRAWLDLALKVDTLAVDSTASPEEQEAKNQALVEGLGAVSLSTEAPNFDTLMRESAQKAGAQEYAQRQAELAQNALSTLLKNDKDDEHEPYPRPLAGVGVGAGQAQ